MTRSDTFTRLFFLGLSTFFIALYTIMNYSHDNMIVSTIVGVIGGFAFGCCAIGIESLCKQLKISTFNLITLGLFFGFLLGQVLSLLIDSLLPSSVTTQYASDIGAVKVCIFLLTSYLGMTIALKSYEDLSQFLPTKKETTPAPKMKAILVDISALYDPRIVDLANTGLVDGSLLLPRFVVQMSNDMNESVDETVRAKGKRCLEHLKKLEVMPSLELRFGDENSAEARDFSQKMLQLAKQYNGSILVGEGSRLQKSSTENAKIINLNDLATAMKPLANSGEFLSIKIQRFGKEAHQGIGYLDDGTMVVVNGGADFLGESIKTQVLSVKHTTSGRIIFCNTLQNGSVTEGDQGAHETTAAQNYFAL